MRKLNLKVFIDESGGFCFGVVNAIQKAENALKNYRNVYCLGQIVHNDDEVSRLEKLGLVTITREDLSVIHHSVILFRAHGEPPETYRKALENNNEIIDASCPIILNIQKKVMTADRNGEFILLFGKHNHPEVISLAGQCLRMPLIIDRFEQIMINELPKQVTIFSQTTMSLREYQDLIKQIETQGVSVKVHNTVCRQVCNREDEIFSFCLRFNKVVFVAGRNSSNGKVLYSKCREANTHTYFVSSDSEIILDWFTANETVGVCGATSTPRWQMEKVKDVLESF